MSVSILILTLNEEQNLLDCLKAVGWSDDIVVLDSYSSDKTVEIARAAGARVIQRPFDNWAAHQNWAVENIDFKFPWVFYLDADERMTPELKEEILSIASNPQTPEAAFYCGRKNFLMGRWLRRSMRSNIMRFFRPEKIRFERLVNPTPVIDGPHGYLKNQFLHFTFSKGFNDWFDRHNRYSYWEALEGLKSIRGETEAKPRLLSKDKAERRRALKQLSIRLPFRPLLKFISLYFFKCGFLDGRPGLIYSILQSIYEYMIVLKMAEIQRREKGLPL